jgi:hypothetical protein
MTKQTNLITDHLRELIAFSEQTLPPGAPLFLLPVERAVLKHGRAFTGIERPKGFRRQRTMKACFHNAGTLALDGRGTYVEGIALLGPDHILPSPHAWITLDGIHAIDPTWKDASMHLYRGIAFPPEIVARAMLMRQSFGILELLTEQHATIPDFAALMQKLNESHRRSCHDATEEDDQ